jgi:ankyrin repeat protein
MKNQDYSPHTIETQVKSELTKWVNLRDRQNDDLTPIQYAASNGNPGMLKLLIKYGAHITVKTSIGAGVMHLAAQSDSVYSIAYFSMMHKESMNERDTDG